MGGDAAVTPEDWDRILARVDASQAAAVTLTVNPRAFVRRPAVPPMTTTRCACGRYFLREGAPVCWECAAEAKEREEFRRTVGTSLTRDEALADLRLLAAPEVPTDDGHLAADYILLRLLADPELAEAWAAVKKWYA